MSGQHDVNKDENPFADPYIALAANEKKDASLSAPSNIPVASEVPPAYNTVTTDTPPAQSLITAYQPTPFSAETQPETLQGINPVFPGQPSQLYTYPSAGYPPAYTPGSLGTQQLNQVELERKANELEAKEQELNRRQQITLKENNFPPLPVFCPWKPCYYHDISVEIPLNSQKTCKMMFYLWQFYVLTLLVNFISALALLISKGGESAGSTFGVSMVYLIIFTPCSFVFWYRPIYKALRDDSSFNYMLFFFIFFFQIVLCVIYGLGIPSFGTVGWINGISEAAQGNGGVAALMLITGLMWTALVLGMIFYLKRIHAAYRSSGASLEKAQGELASGIASNKAVQNVAIQSVRTGMSAGPAPGTRQ